MNMQVTARSKEPVETRDHGLVAGDRRQVVSFIASIFDRPGRPSLAQYVPVADDRTWCLREGNGRIVAGMLARNWRMPSGIAGVNLGYVCVPESLRRRGLGGELVHAAVEREEHVGAAFIMMWARDYLVDFYRAMGFRDLGAETYCDLDVPALASEPGILSAPLTTLPHTGFDSLRRDRPGTIFRTLDRGCWTGINRGFPWASELLIVYAGRPNHASWYAVVAKATSAVTIVEYGGPDDRFASVAGSVRALFQGLPLRCNFTDPGFAAMALPVRGAEAGAGFHRLLRSAALVPEAAPVTSWLDRI